MYIHCTLKRKKINLRIEHPSSKHLNAICHVKYTYNWTLFLTNQTEKYSLTNCYFIFVCHSDKERPLISHHMNKLSLFVWHKQKKVVIVLNCSCYFKSKVSNKITLSKKKILWSNHHYMYTFPSQTIYFFVSGWCVA